MGNLILNNDIYSALNIRIASDAFSGLCSVTVEKVPGSALLVFTSCKYDEDRTIHEFENYLIGLENKAR